MDSSSSLNATEVAVGSLLAGNRGGYGGGGGAWGGNGAGYAPFASPGSNAVRIDKNSTIGTNESLCTREVLGNAIDNMNNNFESVARQEQFTSIKDGQFQSELRTNDRILALQSEVNANARESAKCCCDAKLQACKDHSELKALVIAENSATRELMQGNALAAANAKITQLETINALSGNHHG